MGVAIALFENVMEDARRRLVFHHRKLITAAPEIEALYAGHALSQKRRQQLLRNMEVWDTERIWFTSDREVPVSLDDICTAAGISAAAARYHHADRLVLPFDFRRAYQILWELRYVRDGCRICPRGRCQETRSNHSEGRTIGERMAGPDRHVVPGADSLCGTEAAGRAYEEAPEGDRENASESGLYSGMSIVGPQSGGVVG